MLSADTKVKDSVGNHSSLCAYELTLCCIKGANVSALEHAPRWFSTLTNTDNPPWLLTKSVINICISIEHVSSMQKRIMHSRNNVSLFLYVQPLNLDHSHLMYLEFLILNGLV